ncbi:MAG: class I tRNA ligase family protein [Candidatus Thermoplasmatota archaeon]
MDDDGFDPQVLENKIGDFWNSEGIDRKSSESRRGSKKFYISRQPIPAKDSPNWYELYLSIAYDVWARFKSMQSFDVRNGLGLDSLNQRIERLSKRYQDISCLKALPEDKTSEIYSDMHDKSVEFIESTSEDLHNLGLRIPSEFDYKTTSGGFVDSVWWSFRKLKDKEFLAKKERPVTWCPNCRISPSGSEISVKQEIREKIFVKIPLASGKKRFFLLEVEDIWMFPACLTIAVTPDLKYAVVKIDSEDGSSEQLVMLEKNVESIMKEADIDQYEVVNTISGEQLEGLSFRDPLGDKMPEKAEIEDQGVREVILTEEVPEDGTGFVFLVPKYKEHHRKIADEKGLSTYNPILKNGYFDGGPRKNKYSGLSASTSESVIIDDLEGKYLLFTRKKIDKEVKVCDVCRSRLIRYPIRGWFFETSQTIERFQERAEEINVLHPTNQFGTRDWLVSRDNTWGVPLPKWECTCGSVFVPSDREELADKSDYEPDENIKPDEIRDSTVDCPECGEEMHWEKKTLDPLFIHSCSPWAQLNYPQQEDEYESWWPGQIFLGRKNEDIDLFTANLSLSLTLFDEPSVEEIMFLGSITSEIEYENVEHLISKNGYDSLRMHLLSDKPLWVSRKITRDDLEFPHSIPRVAWNLKRFFEDNLEDMEINLYEISSSTFEGGFRPEDRWILSRLEKAKNDISHNYQRGRFDLVIDSLEELILKDIAQSYIKRARVRLDNESEEGKFAVMRTLYLNLKTISKLLSPVTPFTAENIYQSLNEGEESVFMEDWPEREERYLDHILESTMDDVKNIVDEIINVKRRSELPEKWPLRKVVYKAKNERGMELAEKFADFIREKAMARDIQVVGPDEEWEKIIFKAEPNRDVISETYKHWVRKIETLLKQKSSEKIKKGIEKGGFEIGLEGRIIEIDPDMVSLKREIPEDFEEISFDDQEIFVNLEVTEEIWEEEMVKEVIHRLKSMREDLDLSEEDEIEVHLDADRDVIETIENNRSEIEDEVRARMIRIAHIKM